MFNSHHRFTMGFRDFPNGHWVFSLNRSFPGTPENNRARYPELPVTVGAVSQPPSPEIIYFPSDLASHRGPRIQSFWVSHRSQGPPLPAAHPPHKAKCTRCITKLWGFGVSLLASDGQASLT
jgi:hypothetical protein